MCLLVFIVFSKGRALETRAILKSLENQWKTKLNKEISFVLQKMSCEIDLTKTIQCLWKLVISFLQKNQAPYSSNLGNSRL